MKKILSLAITLLIVLSLASCGIRNSKNMTENNGGAGIRRLSQQNNLNDAYRDGVYKGYGDPHENGNEEATVTIINGRIEEIELTSDNLQRGANNTNAGKEDEGTVIEKGKNTPGSSIGIDAMDPKDKTVSDSINDVKTRLVNEMIRLQQYDVDIENDNNTFAPIVNNWELAVRRALEESRK